MRDQTSPQQRLRLQWADSLRDQLKFLDWTPKRLQYELAQVDCKVSRQAISQWLTGETAPRPHHQAAIAKVCRTSAHRLFSVEGAA